MKIGTKVRVLEDNHVCFEYWGLTGTVVDEVPVTRGERPGKGDPVAVPDGVEYQVDFDNPAPGLCKFLGLRKGQIKEVM